MLYDIATHTIGLVHAGWRGTVARICAATVEAMTARFGTVPANVSAAIGPSISAHRYEVGPEVVAAAEAALGDRVAETLNTPDDIADGRPHFDLWRANVDQLAWAGVPEDAIEQMRVCTGDERARCWSYRRDGAEAGRLVAAIGW